MRSFKEVENYYQSERTRLGNLIYGADNTGRKKTTEDEKKRLERELRKKHRQLIGRIQRAKGDFEVYDINDSTYMGYIGSRVEDVKKAARAEKQVRDKLTTDELTLTQQRRALENAHQYYINFFEAADINGIELALLVANKEQAIKHEQKGTPSNQYLVPDDTVVAFVRDENGHIEVISEIPLKAYRTLSGADDDISWETERPTPKELIGYSKIVNEKRVIDYTRIFKDKGLRRFGTRREIQAQAASDADVSTPPRLSTKDVKPLATELYTPRMSDNLRRQIQAKRRSPRTK